MVGTLLADPRIEVSEVRVLEALDVSSIGHLSFAPEIGAIVSAFNGLRLGWHTTGRAGPRIDGTLHFLLDALRPTHIAGADVLPIAHRWPGVVGVRRSATTISDELVFVGPDGAQRRLSTRPAAYVQALLRTRGAWTAQTVSADAAAQELYLDEVQRLFADISSRDLAFLKELP